MSKKVLTACLLALLLPYIITLAWTGRVEEKKDIPILTSGKKILLDRKNGETYMDIEEYLPGVVAKQIPADYGREALRAQAIIARTYIYQRLNGQNEVRESELNMEYLEEKQMERLWGSEAFMENYKAVEEAVSSTAGTVIQYEGKLIEPLFHRASTGKTRAGDEAHPYIQSVSCPSDVEADGYLTMELFQKEEFLAKINGISGEIAVNPEQILQNLQIVKKDEAGYVEQIQIGTKVYSGEEIQYALGLPSPSFGFEEYEGAVRVICQGTGHGYGFSQYGGKIKAEEGLSAEEILKFFYKNIVLVSE